VVNINGKERVSSIIAAPVDEKRQPDMDKAFEIPCDTVLFSVGLIPEMELARQLGIKENPATGGAEVNSNYSTSVPGVFSAGNVLHVHDLVDFVSQEAEIAGKAAAEYIRGNPAENLSIAVKTDGKIRYTVPQIVSRKTDVTVYFRVTDVYKNVKICVSNGETVLLTKKRLKVAPGEMESVTLKGEQLDQVQELYFSLEAM
jgi:NADPH-dependent 2,4-dienoyl-CoA reductase/sulfur reductase-like enzyme